MVGTDLDHAPFNEIEFFFFNSEIFGGIFYVYFIQHCFSCRPSYSNVSGDAGIEPWTVMTVALAAGRSNHSARSHENSFMNKQSFFLLTIIAVHKKLIK